jgi:hypothetical protein
MWREASKEDEAWEGRRLKWVCVQCQRPCGDHPKAQLGALVQGSVVKCFSCFFDAGLEGGEGI